MRFVFSKMADGNWLFVSADGQPLLAGQQRIVFTSEELADVLLGIENIESNPAVN